VDARSAAWNLVAGFNFNDPELVVPPAYENIADTSNIRMIEANLRTDLINPGLP